MQNSECRIQNAEFRMQNYGIFYRKYFNSRQRRHIHLAFSIMHSAFHLEYGYLLSGIMGRGEKEIGVVLTPIFNLQQWFLQER